MDIESESIFQNKKNLLKKIQSKYILKLVMENMKENIRLNLIKYNKSLQKKIDIKLKDYAEYSKIVIIEIVPSKVLQKAYFINFEPEEKDYFKIYFDGKRRKENYITKKDNVSKIKIIIKREFKKFDSLFYHCKFIEKINFVCFNRDDIEDMSNMFEESINLKEINFNSFNTKNVTNMGSMFSDCNSLTKLNLSKFDTSNVVYMDYMFNNCINLEELDISNFDSSNVKDMSRMFHKCSFLNKIIHQKLNANKVTSANEMLFKCSSLKELNITFNTNLYIYNYQMLYGCSNELKKCIKKNNKNLVFKK